MYQPREDQLKSLIVKAWSVIEVSGFVVILLAALFTIANQMNGGGTVVNNYHYDLEQTTTVENKKNCYLFSCK